ncbi:hypothetical protein [Delftia tsuruhatensis]|uniref:hypothetical protein n=1 Tax=Delftia tsuruhatensis TaxID=180282 RepID=UPI002260A873|nr:hypothetical protein [Delftia tsuruhatensis]MCX7505891.1 hypothetical protein [Delftia tsuruhatensis]
MISGVYTHLAAAGTAFVIGACGAWWTQGQRYSLQLEQLRHQQSAGQLADARQAVQSMAEFQKRMTDALANFQTTNQRNSAAQQDLERSLRDLRSTTAGMRSDVAGLPERLEGVNPPALAQYASTCTALLAELAERGGRMAERGAGIARAADGHAADAALMSDTSNFGSH